MPRLPPFTSTRIVRPTQTALALQLISEFDLLRLKTLARLHARGLPPDIGWEDLLQEALTRVLLGARPQPADVPMVAFLAGVMRSLKSAHWRRFARSARQEPRRLARRSGDSQELELRDPAPELERQVIAQQALDSLLQLFASDPVALQIIAGLGEGLSPQQIQIASGLSRTAYHSARRRIRRALLREGLTCAAR